MMKLVNIYSSHVHTITLFGMEWFGWFMIQHQISKIHWLFCWMLGSLPWIMCVFGFYIQVTIYYIWRERKSRLHHTNWAKTDRFTRIFDKAIRNRTLSLSYKIPHYVKGYYAGGSRWQTSGKDEALLYLVPTSFCF